MQAQETLKQRILAHIFGGRVFSFHSFQGIPVLAATHSKQLSCRACNTCRHLYHVIRIADMRNTSEVARSTVSPMLMATTDLRFCTGHGHTASERSRWTIYQLIVVPNAKTGKTDTLTKLRALQIQCTWPRMKCLRVWKAVTGFMCSDGPWKGILLVQSIELGPVAWDFLCDHQECTYVKSGQGLSGSNSLL